MMSMFWNTASAVPAIPLRLRNALARGQDVEGLVALRPEEVPAALQMADQAVRLVLRRHADAADAGIQCVRQGEIDDARLAAEIDRGFGADIGQFHQAAAASAGQHVRHGGTGERGTEAGGGRRHDVILSVVADVTESVVRPVRAGRHGAGIAYRRRQSSRRRDARRSASLPHNHLPSHCHRKQPHVHRGIVSGSSRSDGADCCQAKF